MLGTNWCTHQSEFGHHQSTNILCNDNNIIWKLHLTTLPSCNNDFKDLISIKSMFFPKWVISQMQKLLAIHLTNVFFGNMTQRFCSNFHHKFFTLKLKQKMIVTFIRSTRSIEFIDRFNFINNLYGLELCSAWIGAFLYTCNTLYSMIGFS